MNPTKSWIFVPNNLVKLIVYQSSKEWVLKKCDGKYIVSFILIIIILLFSCVESYISQFKKC